MPSTNPRKIAVLPSTVIVANKSCLRLVICLCPRSFRTGDDYGAQPVQRGLQQWQNVLGERHLHI
jgi:hypothetical protein